MGKSMRYEVASINRGMQNYQRSEGGGTGEAVLYFEFDPSGSSSHAIYDEGPSRAWFAPFNLPVMFLDFHQDDPVDGTDGLYVVSSCSFTFQLSLAWDRFRIPPVNSGAHFKDRFAYGNPMTAYTVTDYEKQALVNGRYLTISVRGQQLKEEEFFNDVQFRDYFSQGGAITK